MAKLTILLISAALCFASVNAIVHYPDFKEIVDETNAKLIVGAFDMAYSSGAGPGLTSIFENRYKGARLANDCSFVSFSGPHGAQQQNHVAFATEAAMAQATAQLKAVGSSIELHKGQIKIQLLPTVCTKQEDLYRIVPTWAGTDIAVYMTPNDCGVTAETLTGIRKVTGAPAVKETDEITSGFVQETLEKGEKKLYNVKLEFSNGEKKNRLVIKGKTGEVQNVEQSCTESTVSASLWPKIARDPAIMALKLSGNHGKIAAEAANALNNNKMDGYNLEAKYGFDSSAHIQVGCGLKIIKITGKNFGAPYHYAGVIMKTADGDYMTMENWASGGPELANEKWFFGAFESGLPKSAPASTLSAKDVKSFHNAHVKSFYDSSLGGKTAWNSAITWGFCKVGASAGTPSKASGNTVKLTSPTGTPHESHKKKTSRNAMFAQIKGFKKLRKRNPPKKLPESGVVQPDTELQAPTPKTTAKQLLKPSQ